MASSTATILSGGGGGDGNVPNYIPDSPDAADPDQDELEEDDEVGVTVAEKEVENPSSSPIGADNSSFAAITTVSINKENLQNMEYGRLEKKPTSSFIEDKAEAGLQTETCTIVDSTKSTTVSDPPNEQQEAPNGKLYVPHTVSSPQKDSGGPDYALPKKDSGSLTGKATPKVHDEVHHDIDSYSTKSVIGDDEIATSSSAVVKVRTSINQDTNAAFHMARGKEQSEDTKERTSSLAANTGPSSLSLPTKFANGVKQPTVLCRFFSKGWCSKGNSCKFLHVKGQIPDQQSERTEGAAEKNSKLHLNEGFIDGTEKSRFGSLCNQQAPSSRNTRIDTSTIVESNFSTVQNNNSVMPSRAYHSSWMPSSYAARMDELGAKQSHSQFNNPGIPSLSCYPSSATNFSLPTSGIFPSDCFSDRTISFFAQGSSAFIADSPYGKLLNRDGVFHASSSVSLLRNSSSISGSEPYITHTSGVGVKRKFASYDWEPSKPFRPSFFISMPGMSGPGGQYDPIRDSIEQAITVDGAFKVYSLGDPNLNGMLHSHQNFQDNSLDKDGNVHKLNLAVEEAEAAGSSVNNQHSEKIVLKEEKPVTSHAMDVTETNKTNISFDARHPSASSRHRKELKGDRGRHRDDMVVDQKTDACSLEDSKAIRYFRSTLVEHVKEVLKPTWREGCLSKDAHNLIVKRAVEKVLSTIQPHQLPSTVESSQQYISFSEAKIAKLVEGYVEKYGKS